jgi:hypothetical protein
MPLGERRPVMAVKIKAGSIAAGLVAQIQLQAGMRAPYANISFGTVAGRTSVAVEVGSNEKPAGYRQKPVSPEGRCAQTETQNWQSAFTRNRTLG